jgi:hypothetical protein
VFQKIRNVRFAKRAEPGAFEDLLDCSELAGLEMQQEIDVYFKKFK